MSQQLCALTLMALILGYGTFAAPQMVMRPVNQAKEIGYQGKSGLPRPKIRRKTTFTSTKTQAHTSPGEPHGLERMWTKSWAQSASWTGLGASKVAILWIYKLFFSREKHGKRVEINEVSEVSRLAKSKLDAQGTKGSRSVKKTTQKRLAIASGSHLSGKTKAFNAENLAKSDEIELSTTSLEGQGPNQGQGRQVQRNLDRLDTSCRQDSRLSGLRIDRNHSEEVHPKEVNSASVETTRATRTTDKAVSTNRLQESEVETSLAKIIAAVMSEDDSFGSKLEGLDAEKGHFAAQKVSSRSSRMIGILETAQEIELAEAGIASKETAQVKMNNQLAQGSELGDSMEGSLQHARMSRDGNSMYTSGMDGTSSYELGHALMVETRGMEAAAAEGSAPEEVYQHEEASEVQSAVEASTSCTSS